MPGEPLHNDPLTGAQHDDVLMNLVEQALAVPIEERETCLRSACRDNPALFDEAWSYVQREQRMNGFLMNPLYRIPVDEHPFKPGDLLLGRFRIEREVAEGGMGIVYEAHDEKLDRRIALKCAKAGFRQRLPPEVLHASEISHPNVCKIFEIHTVAVPQGEVDFLTMEFLDGETLAERLKRGRAPEAEARAIALQLCAGLAEAHRNRVVHGDLKSNNVILAKGADGSLRAVITDFGLARKPGMSGATGMSGLDVGTPDYMAPELLNGAKASVASDIYALGIVLRELVTGRGPAGGVGAAPTIPPKWERVIARCADPDPSRRFQSAEPVAEALMPRHIGRWLVAGGVAALLAMATGMVSYERAAAPKNSWRLALLPISASAEISEIAAKASRDTATQIAKLKGGDIARLAFLPPEQLRRKGVDTPENAHSVLHATHVLKATLTKEGGKLILRAALMDERSHEWTAEYALGEERFIPVAVAGFVTETLGLPPLVAAPVVNTVAGADYAAGLAVARQNGAVDISLDSMGRAVNEDPDSPLTHTGLGEAQWLKYKLTGEVRWLDLAKEQAREAEIRNADLSAVHDLAGLLKAEEADAGWFVQAQAQYLRAIELDPANGEAWRRLGQAYEANNQLDDALAAFKRAVQVLPADTWSHQSLAAYFYHRADYADAVPELQTLVRLAPNNPNAHYALATAYGELGRFGEDERELLTSIDLGESVQAEHSLGYVYVLQGRYEEAISRYLKALTVSGPKTALLWLNLGVAYSLSGKNEKAREAYAAGLPLAEEQLTGNQTSGRFRAERAYLFGVLGRPGAEAEAKAAAHFSPSDKDTLWMASATFEVLGHTDQTIQLLRDCPEEMRSSLLSDLKRYPGMPSLHKDPRFIEMAALYHVQ